MRNAGDALYGVALIVSAAAVIAGISSLGHASEFGSSFAYALTAMVVGGASVGLTLLAAERLGRFPRRGPGIPARYSIGFFIVAPVCLVLILPLLD
jgi:hypothetical protein